jgi:VCBS repeat-containing protein
LVPPEKKIELGIGDTHSIRLQGRGTAGYEWSYNIEGEHGIIEISHGSGYVHDVNSDKNDDKQLAVGQSIDEIFVIQGIRRGRAIVHFLQRRPWEIDAPPLDKADVEVIVLGNKP